VAHGTPRAPVAPAGPRFPMTPATIAPGPSPAEVDILGVKVNATSMDQTLEVIDGWIARREPRYVCVSGMHGVMESQRDEGLRSIHNSADLVTPDGMSLVWLCKLKGERTVERVYGPDLMLALCARSAERGYRHFFYGASPQVLDALTERLCARYPGLEVVGTCSPPFRPLTPEEDAEIVDRIARARPDIVWVGLSTPKQERWMADHVGPLGASVLIGVGAAFDFHAGTKRQAPRWMQRNGLEWLFRLLSEPRRLYRRYLVNIPLFGCYLVLDALGLRERRHPRS
jgi:N-acetylglucosaminyldiphosphoundecaprenol N-acetyl-beta-D-mannosaminyltransferase